MNRAGAVLVATLLIGGGTRTVAAHQGVMGYSVSHRSAAVEGRVSVAPSDDIVALERVVVQPQSRGPFSQMLTKLLRGFVNVSTGWIELPKAISGLSEEWGYGFALTVGSLKGIESASLRTLAGLVEAATFPVPMPAGYQPVVTPSTVLTPGALSLRSLR